ncbi:MAG: pseudouridine-5'-phosphate glycosidase [Candidatus Limnocylindrales bacterium]
MPTKPPDRPAPTGTRFRPPHTSSHRSPYRSAALAGRLDLAPEVAEALAAGRPVVALESTLISHGLPYPRNVEVALASEAAIRESGAVPATVAIRDGRFIVGLDGEGVQALATARDVRKAARPTLAAALVGGGWAATTVSATMIAAHAAGIRVFATGGIGGVHRGAIGGRNPTLDVSSDLEELARTPVAVVCAGPKAILDVSLTVEYLETRGVPVVAVGSDEVPGFYSRRSGVTAPESAPDEAAAARLVATHLGLGLGSGLLVCVPVPAAEELPLDEARDAIRRAIADAEATNIGGPALTPWLLARVAELTGGASIRANTALIVNDARVAGRLAAALAGHARGSRG